MPTISFADFRGGLDRRRVPSVADANKLRVLTNAYVTHGYTIRKRPGLRLAYELTAGTKGLVAASGKLHTFSDGDVSHATSAVVNHRAADAALTVAGASYGENYNGYLYAAVTYSNGSTQHHYFDAPGSWAATTAYAVGAFRTPTTANGLRYEVTAIAGTGTSGASEPAWPTTVGATVIDNAGANQITWTCRSFKVTDVNCTHSKQVEKNGSKLFAVGDETVRFCATNNARDWTTASDAGFLPVGVQASGDSTPTALGKFESYLAVFFEDAIQTWQVGPDPATHAIQKTAYLGTRYAFAHGNMGADVFFLSQVGFRSVSTANQVGTLQDLDVGSPIDSLLQEEMRSAIEPKTVYWRGGGMLLCFIGSRIYVYSISRAAKVSAWSLWETNLTVDAAAEVDGVMYLRSGDFVYALDPFVYTDNGTKFEVHVELPYMDCKAPGVDKQFVGVDLVMTGTARVAHRFDPRDETQITGYIEAEGDTRSGGMIPVELVTTNISPVIKNLTDEEFELAAISYHYNNLSVWG